MQLRLTPSNKEGKERLTRKKISKDKIRNLGITKVFRQLGIADTYEVYYDFAVK
jgi:hypothetical protein